VRCFDCKRTLTYLRRSFMDLIQIALSRNGFQWGRFDGSMDMKKRGAAIAEFKAPSTAPKIMIISLKAGGVGLNVSDVRFGLTTVLTVSLVDRGKSCLYHGKDHLSLGVKRSHAHDFQDCWWNAAVENQGMFMDLDVPLCTDSVCLQRSTAFTVSGKTSQYSSLISS
jgi:hypothetical protein